MTTIMTTIKRLDSWEIPLQEVSALCVRLDPFAGTEQVLAVADERWAVGAMTLDASGATVQPTTHVDTAVAQGGLATGEDSEFEDVAVDIRGRVFVLQEGPARVPALDPNMDRLQHMITLDVPPDQPDIGAGWADSPNARGEGLLLLRDGHMLIAKQRNPVRLIEFGPAGDAPFGYAPGDSLAERDEAFLVLGDQSSVVEVLATWLLDDAPGVESINDLAVDAEGRLHFVSSRSRCIARLEGALKPGVNTVDAEVMPLPSELFESDDDKAEGLVFSGALGWLLAMDMQRTGANLHRLALSG